MFPPRFRSNSPSLFFHSHDFSSYFSYIFHNGCFFLSCWWGIRKRRRNFLNFSFSARNGKVFFLSLVKFDGIFLNFLEFSKLSNFTTVIFSLQIKDAVKETIECFRMPLPSTSSSSVCIFTQEGRRRRKSYNVTI